jgi:hypothetical protein
MQRLGLINAGTACGQPEMVQLQAGRPPFGFDNNRDSKGREAQGTATAVVRRAIGVICTCSGAMVRGYLERGLVL